MPYLSVKNLSASFECQHVLHEVSFEIEKSTLNCFVGPSGSGKTTLLRCLAGFHRARVGEISLDQDTLFNEKTFVLPEDRRIGIVFQDFALFPHLRVSQNILFGIRKLAREEQRDRLNELLRLTDLEDLADRYPHELSGGQQQRVAIARAIAPRPRLLLLDEPFSQIDPELRERLVLDLQRLLTHLKITSVLVTHHQEEAFQLADRIGVLHEGRLQQWASAYELYHSPANRFVADFIGDGSFITGHVIDDFRVKTCLGDVTAQLPPGLPPETPLSLLVRPDDLTYDEAGVACRILAKSFRGPFFMYRLQTPDSKAISVLLPSHINRPLGEMLPVSLEMKHLVCFQEDGSSKDENLIR